MYQLQLPPNPLIRSYIFFFIVVTSLPKRKYLFFSCCVYIIIRKRKKNLWDNFLDVGKVFQTTTWKYESRGGLRLMLSSNIYLFICLCWLGKLSPALALFLWFCYEMWRGQRSHTPDAAINGRWKLCFLADFILNGFHLLLLLLLLLLVFLFIEEWNISLSLDVPTTKFFLLSSSYQLVRSGTLSCCLLFSGVKMFSD